VAIIVVLMFAKAALIRRLPHSSDQAVSYLVDKVLKFIVFLLASWIMAKIETRTIADYGLPWWKMFGRPFWIGAAMALVGLTGFLTLARLAGVFRFGELALRGNEMWKWGALYGFGFIIVALEEEFHYRGYGLSTLTKGIGFWPAAIASSAVFGYSHLGNSGENWLGAFNAGAGGLFFCLLLQRSGDLWMPIGFHASLGWTQTYFYGVPNSGHVLPDHLLSGNFFGPSWLTGGTVGPEGSVPFTLLVILFWLAVSTWMRETRYPV
jgi:membrane protease YdiL (CAAX protease family)